MLEPVISGLLSGTAAKWVPHAGLLGEKMISIDNIKIESKPDFGRFLKVLKREGKPDRVPFFELFSDIQQKVAGHLVCERDCSDAVEYTYRLRAVYNERLGYDYFDMFSPYYFPSAAHSKADEGRTYVQAADSMVGSWEDMERYPWPDVSKISWADFERCRKYLPDGMKCVAMSPGGIEEAVLLNIMGYERLCLALYDDRKLVKEIFDRVGAVMVYLFERYVSYDFVGAVIISDDLGFKTQTMLPPAAIREYIFPWYRKLVDIAHNAGRPVILHSCGNLREIHEDLIGLGIDAKHSYEDVILPVWEFKKLYGKRMTPLGGFDVDKICRESRKEVVKHTRFLIDSCARDGGYAIGTGNSVADYINVENFLTMLEEAFNYSRN